MKQHTAILPHRTLGLDLGDRQTAMCVLDRLGTVVEEVTFTTGRDELTARFEHAEASRVVLEASRQSNWISRLLRSFGHEVIVANPRELHLISKSVRKTDRNDARTLVRFGRVDPELLKPVHQRSEAMLAVRALLNARRGLTLSRARLINIVRGSSKAFGQSIRPSSSACFARAARRELSAELKDAMEPLLIAFETLTEQIREYDRKIEALCEQHSNPTGLFRQVYGVGPQVALAYFAAIEDPARFERSRDVGPYLGLTPKAHQSGASNPRLRITKQGDGSVRSLLVTAATLILRRSAPDSDLKRYGRRIARGKAPRDKARARIAVARKLAVLLHRMWTTGEVYEPRRGVQAKD